MNKEAIFDTYKSLLFSIAYKLTGTVADSEDIVQDVMEKWLRMDTNVKEPKAYLAKAVTNQSISFLRSKQKEREAYFGLWLPEPLPEPFLEPQSQDDELSYGFLLIFSQLSPLERSVYILRSGFELSYEELAHNFMIREDHCRQIYHRAKEKLRRARRSGPSHADQRTTLQLFEEACTTGDLSKLILRLKEDVVLYSDGGGKVPAAVNNIEGKANASKFLKGIYQKNGTRAIFKFTYLNGQAAAIVLIDGRPDTVAILESAPEGISSMFFIRNPEKLAHLQELSVCKQWERY